MRSSTNAASFQDRAIGSGYWHAVQNGLPALTFHDSHFGQDDSGAPL